MQKQSSKRTGMTLLENIRIEKKKKGKGKMFQIKKLSMLY